MTAPVSTPVAVHRAASALYGPRVADFLAACEVTTRRGCVHVAGPSQVVRWLSALLAPEGDASLAEACRAEWLALAAEITGLPKLAAAALTWEVTR